MIILRPLINEKSMALTKNSFYTFEVSKDASKGQIAKYIKGKFKVDVLSVKTINVKPKVKLQRTRKGYFKTHASKKAIVGLKKGQKLALFESAVVQEESHSAKASRDGEVEVRTAEGESMGTVKQKRGLFGGPKVKIEKASGTGQQVRVDSEKVEKQSDTKRPTKVSQKEKGK